MLYYKELITVTRKCTDYWVVEIDEMLGMGFSTKHIAKKFNIPHEVLLEVLEQRRQERDRHQAIVNKKYKNTMYE